MCGHTVQSEADAQKLAGDSGSDSGKRRRFWAQLRAAPTGNQYWALLGLYGFAIPFFGIPGIIRLLRGLEEWLQSNLIRYEGDLSSSLVAVLGLGYYLCAIISLVVIARAMIIRKVKSGIGFANCTLFFAQILAFAYALAVVLLFSRFILPYVDGYNYAKAFEFLRIWNLLGCLMLIPPAIPGIVMIILRRGKAGPGETLIHILSALIGALWTVQFWDMLVPLPSC